MISLHQVSKNLEIGLSGSSDSSHILRRYKFTFIGQLHLQVTNLHMNSLKGTLKGTQGIIRKGLTNSFST